MTTNNGKNCLLEATAHALSQHLFRNPDIPVDNYNLSYSAWKQSIIDSAGHNGEGRGFHSQEIQDALRENGYLMQRHELYPCMQLPSTIDEAGKLRPNVIPIYHREEVESIFLPKLNHNLGVLVVKRGSVHHGLAWQPGSNTAYDVNEDKYIPLEDLDIVLFLEFIHEAYPSQ